MDEKRFAQFTYLYVTLLSLAFGLFISFVYIPYSNLIFYLVTYLPPILILFIKRYPLINTLALRPVSVPQLLFAIAIGICGTVVVLIVNNLLNFSPSNANLLASSLNNFSIWPELLTWFTAAILVELVFRGIIQNGFQHIAPLKLCIIISLLFVFPSSLFDIPSQILIGFLYALLAYKTSSVIPAVVAHFLVLALKEPISCLVFNIGLMWGNLFTLIFLSLAAIGLLILLFAKIPGRTLKTGKDAVSEKFRPHPAFIAAVIIVTLCTLWLTGLDVYFMLNM